jgi:hypothetical protein
MNKKQKPENPKISCLVHNVVTKKLKNTCATQVTTNYLISMIGRQMFPNEHVNLSRFRGEQRTSQSETWLQLLNIQKDISDVE